MKFEMRKRQRFLWILLGFILLALILPQFLPEPSVRKKAIIVFTHIETKRIADVLAQRAAEVNGLTNIDNNIVAQGVLGTNYLHLNYEGARTNFQGEIIDWWKTPYQIEILARMNFVVRSAGPNKIFGDGDDIIFDSASNDFVKP